MYLLLLALLSSGCTAQPGQHREQDIRVLMEKMDRLEDWKQQVEEVLNQHTGESSFMFDNLTREMCSQLESQQCVETDKFEQLFDELDEAVRQIRNVTLRQARVQECQLDEQALTRRVRQVARRLDELDKGIIPGDCK